MLGHFVMIPLGLGNWQLSLPSIHWFTKLFIDSLCIYSLLFAFTHPSVHSFTLWMIYSFISFVHSKIHAVMHSRIRAYMHSHIHAYMHRCIHTYMHTCKHASMHLFISFHSIPFHFIHSPIHSTIHSMIYSFIRSFSDPFIHSFICLFVPVIQSFMYLTPSIHSISHALIQSKDFTIGPSSPIFGCASQLVSGQSPQYKWEQFGTRTCHFAWYLLHFGTFTFHFAW